MARSTETSPGQPVDRAADRPAGGASPIVGAMRTAVVGMSEGATCGARDHATLLAGALAAQQVSCSTHWLERTAGSPRAELAEIRSWSGELARELARSRPDAVLLHYSAFSYAHRGVPFFVRPTLAALRGIDTPVITVLHEFAYPWRALDWRGNVWALTQRAALIDIMRASRAAVVTADFRADWLHSKRWLPDRAVAIAPVFSNLPPPSAVTRPDPRVPVVGLFGYSYESASVSLVLDAWAQLLASGRQLQLRLLGAPGPQAPAGKQWRTEAQARGVSGSLSFTGVLEAQALSDALADCDLLLFADSPGPTSRKGTLAGSLASGSPVLAIDGPRTWSELVAADALRVVAPTSTALAQALAAMLADATLREALGRRGRAFAEQRMGLEHSAEVVAELLGDVLATAPTTAAAR